MKIYYLFLEGKPFTNNEESKEVAGAYINCWVKAKNESSAKDLALKYIHTEGWEILNIEDIYIVNRKIYSDIPESLECYCQAKKYGVGAIFNTWPIGSEE